jgi:hypothetical protein
MNFLFVLVLAMAFSSIACAENIPKNRELFPVEIDEKYGYIDKTGKIIIPPKFDHATDFSEGLAAISKGDAETGLMGYIDTKGNVVIKPKYEWGAPFKEGVAIARYKNQLILIDKTGKQLQKYEIDMAENGFAEGVAAKALVFKNRVGVFYGFIDKTGKVVIPPVYRHALNFSEGLASVEEDSSPRKKNRKMGFIDHNNKWVIPPQFKLAKSFSEGLAAVYSDRDQCGYIDKAGKVIIPAKFKQCGDFSEGLAAVSTDGLTSGYINTNGEMVIAPQFIRATPFSGGWAEVIQQTTDEFVVLRGYIDKSGKFVWGPRKSRWDP